MFKAIRCTAMRLTLITAKQESGKLLQPGVMLIQHKPKFKVTGISEDEVYTKPQLIRQIKS